jgi:hemerythrin-like domain-containing protein
MQATDRYAEFIWEHMSMEEKDVIPACQQHFTSEDWKLIADAFEKNSDPRFEKERAAGFDRLFARIMNLAERNREQS